MERRLAGAGRAAPGGPGVGDRAMQAPPPFPEPAWTSGERVALAAQYRAGGRHLPGGRGPGRPVPDRPTCGPRTRLVREAAAAAGGRRRGTGLARAGFCGTGAVGGAAARGPAATCCAGWGSSSRTSGRTPSECAPSRPCYLQLPAAQALRAVIEDFEEDESPLADVLEARVAARVCKRAAVKAGQVLSLVEQEQLLRDLEACAMPRACPHGRPTMIHLSVDIAGAAVRPARASHLPSDRIERRGSRPRRLVPGLTWITYGVAGRRTVKVLPFPISLTTSIVPRLASTMRLAIASPSPVPGVAPS